MLATRPELSVYSRLSYLRELQGDRAGAINAMQQAVDSGLATAEGTLWSRVQLGHLYFNQGDLAQAEKVYLQTLTFNPDYIYAFAGLARVQAGQGKHDEAIEYYETIVETLPLPEFVIALADLYEVTGQPAKAKQQIDLVQAIQQLSSQAGLNVDLELALFNADHGIEPAQTLRQARAAYAERPGIYGADTLAWALYQNGEYEEALVYSQEALRLNTQDALLHFHAGLINRALGRTAAAQTHLAQALQINPHFSIRYAPQAQTLLLELQPSDE
jgi:tetratricopeptide (TPR) repeat protein